MRTSLWPRLVVLGVGLSTFSLQAWASFSTGQAGDPTLISGSLILTGIGLGLAFDWWKR